MKIIALITLLLVVSPIIAESTNNFSVSALFAYNKWRYANKRTYFSLEEQQFRQQIFFETHQRIENHNQNPEATYKLAHNQFSDMPQEEFASRVLMKSAQIVPRDAVQAQNNSTQQQTAQEAQLPASFDWRDYGILSDVKDQGQCGSCWAFSTTGILEALYYMENRQKISFSEQQLVDCAVNSNGFNSYGCSGGWPEEALKYVSKFGILKEEQYPYLAADSKCKVTTPTSDGFKVQSFYFIDKTADALKNTVARIPVSVLVDASTWGSYSSGVYNGCGNTQTNNLNHAVVAIGYDEQGNWIIRNSWSTSWGMDGHMKLAPGNTCGILLSPLIAVR
ncbi:hypothetical protein ABPG74_003606 [Tetrahymena malaccensis]